MNQTINVSLPKNLTDLARAQVKAGMYSSLSEVIRDAMRRMLNPRPKITVNGFTEEFENEVLAASESPQDKDLVFESADDLEKYFNKLGIKTK